MPANLVRILVALEPRSYSEVIGEAIRELRPNLEVIIVDPDELISEVARLGPEMVLCSQHSPSACKAIVWIEYCPYIEPKAKIFWDDEQCLKLEVIGLADLLSAVDRGKGLARAKLREKY